MAVLVYSVVKRHMKRSSAFVVAGDAEPPHSISTSPSERLIGWYQNPPPWENYFIFFTSEAIHLVGKACIERVPLEAIVGYESPPSKIGVTGLRLLTTDGVRFVRIAGTTGATGSGGLCASTLASTNAFSREA